MIDLTDDDEPPRKQARIDTCHSRMEARNTAPAPQDMRGSFSHEAQVHPNNAYVNGPMVQMQGPCAPAPQPIELAHPPDLLDCISMAVASLEMFQLREILSTAALRHPGVLELLRTSFRTQETHRTTAHQALYDLLVSQSQEEARIVRVRDERARRDSVYMSRPYCPPPIPSGAPGDVGGTAEPVKAIRVPWGPEHHFAQPATTPGQMPEAPAGPQQHDPGTRPPGQTPITQPLAPALPPQVSGFHAAINRLSGPVWYMSDATKLDALKTLCNAAIEFVTHADTTLRDHLRKDKVFTETCWRIYNHLDARSKLSLPQTKRLGEALDRLEQVRDGCFVGFAEFLSVFKKDSIPEWREGVRGLDDEGPRRIITERPGVMFYRKGELEDDEDDEDGDADSLPDQYDSYDGMDEEEEEEEDNV